MVSLGSDDKSREFLRSVDERDGRASTGEIRDDTGLSASEMQYRYNKLEDKGLIQIERDSEATPDGVAPEKVAVLTGVAREEIQQGLLVPVEEETDDAGASVEELNEEVADLESTLTAVRARLEAVEEEGVGGGVSEEYVEGEMASIREDVESIRSLVNDELVARTAMLAEAVGRIEMALEKEGVELSDVEVSRSKMQEMRDRTDKKAEAVEPRSQSQSKQRPSMFKDGDDDDGGGRSAGGVEAVTNE